MLWVESCVHVLIHNRNIYQNTHISSPAPYKPENNISLHKQKKKFQTHPSVHMLQSVTK